MYNRTVLSGAGNGRLLAGSTCSVKAYNSGDTTENAHVRDEKDAVPLTTARASPTVMYNA